MFLVRAWYNKALWLHTLRPLAWVFRHLAARRRTRLTAQQVEPSVPVVIVGNITVGGTGKTPAVQAIAEALQQRGLRVAVLSRGYGGSAGQYPLEVTAHSTVEETGDEAYLLRRRLSGQLLLDPDRQRGLEVLIDQGNCDVVISDDGLQHYRLWRDIEVIMVDGVRGLGNGLCLPAGPLREPPQRLHEADYVVINGCGQPLPERLSAGLPVSHCHLAPTAWVNVSSGERIAPEEMAAALGVQPDKQGIISHDNCGRPIMALAGIGNPQRFFDSLRENGIVAQCQAFPDHHPYREEELLHAIDRVVLMTEKDAVKCERFAGPQWWYLEVNARLESGMLNQLCDRVDALRERR